MRLAWPGKGQVRASGREAYKECEAERAHIGWDFGKRELPRFEYGVANRLEVRFQGGRENGELSHTSHL